VRWLIDTLPLIYYDHIFIYYVVFELSTDEDVSVYHVVFKLTMSICSSQSLLEMSTKDMDFVQLNQLIGRKTGGISVYPFTSSVSGKEDPLTHIIVRGKAMAPRVEDLFNLVCFFIIV
jgi:Zn-dependent M16 (insulinase) family peptidase